MSIQEPNRITRRCFCRSLALPAGALVLGSAMPAWAKKKKKIQEDDKPSTSTPIDPNYETKVIWESGDIYENAFNAKTNVRAYNKHAYMGIVLTDRKVMILKAPLEGGEAQLSPLLNVTAGTDPHRFYDIGIDSLGYIHVVGDMHSSAHVKHWISKKPEDITEFISTSDSDANKRPGGHKVTYPHLFRSPDGVLYHCIRCANPVWGICISVLNVKTQTWAVLGAEIPAGDLHNKHERMAVGKSITAWEDNGEGGNFGYTQPHAHIVWDKKKRMHLVLGLLNENTPSAAHGHTGSDVLYAYSDDGGKTFHRGDGSQIELPMRAEAGPHQADVVYSRHVGPPPWVGLNPSIHIDGIGRPVVGVYFHKSGSGWHKMVLDQGKWTELGKSTDAQSTDVAAKPTNEDEEEEDDDKSMMFEKRPQLPYGIYRLDGDYLRDTGNFLYIAKPAPKGNNKLIIALSKPVKATTAQIPQ